jgi:hypothetical protein
MSATEIITTVSAAIAAVAALVTIWRANTAIEAQRVAFRAELASQRIAQLSGIADLLREVIDACLADERDNRAARIGGLSPVPAIGLRLDVAIAAYSALGGRELVQGLLTFAGQAQNAIQEPPGTVRGWAQANLSGLVKYIHNESNALGHPHGCLADEQSRA